MMAVGPDPFNNCAWIFSDDSLNDLYSIPFTDPQSGINEIYTNLAYSSQGFMLTDQSGAAYQCNASMGGGMSMN